MAHPIAHKQSRDAAWLAEQVASSFVAVVVTGILGGAATIALVVGRLMINSDPLFRVTVGAAAFVSCASFGLALWSSRYRAILDKRFPLRVQVRSVRFFNQPGRTRIDSPSGIVPLHSLTVQLNTVRATNGDPVRKMELEFRLVFNGFETNTSADDRFEVGPESTFDNALEFHVMVAPEARIQKAISEEPPISLRVIDHISGQSKIIPENRFRG